MVYSVAAPRHSRLAGKVNLKPSSNVDLGRTRKPGKVDTGSDPFYQNVSLLLPCNLVQGSTNFIDYSPNPKTVTANGDAQISTAQSVFGIGSALFDGTGDFLQIPTSTDFDFGSGDFTIEFWIYLLSNAGTSWLIGKGDAATVSGSSFSFQRSGNWDLYYNTSSSLSLTAPSISLNTWTYLAITRNGTAVSITRNGIQTTSGTLPGGASINNTVSNLSIGSYATGGTNAHFNQIRITKVIARDVSVVPTAPFPIS